MSDMDVTLGEVYRLVQRVLEQTTKTNGRVDRAEDQILKLQGDMDALKALTPEHGRHRPAVSTLHGSDLELNVKKLSAWLAGGAIAAWGAVKLIWLAGDWLQKAGLR
jgi:hypothetical protein